MKKVIIMSDIHYRCNNYYDRDAVSSCYVIRPHRYKIRGVFFTNEYAEQNKWSLKF